MTAQEEPDALALIFHRWIEGAHSAPSMQGGWLPRPVIAVARVAQPWFLQQTGITSIVIGANTREQLEDNP